MYVHRYLLDLESNIDAAARLMAIYLRELQERLCANTCSPAFLEDIASGLTEDDLEFLADRRGASVAAVSEELARAMASMWNNHTSVLREEDVFGHMPNAYNHAQNAGRLHMVHYGEISRLLIEEY
jgi:hypothetical protein